MNINLVNANLNSSLWLVVAVIAIVAVVIVIFGWIFYRRRRSDKEFERSVSSPKPLEKPPASKTEKIDVFADRPVYELPESGASRIQRLKARLANSGAFGKAVLGFFTGADLSAYDWEEIENILIMADLGVDTATQLVQEIQAAVQVEGNMEVAAVKELLRKKLLDMLQVSQSRQIAQTHPMSENGESIPIAMLVVGVNGSGKTTTVGKIARILVAEEKSVILGAADTFRAAAAEQITTWGERVGVQVVSSPKEGADPASVAFEAVKTAVEKKADVVLVDTAGRLQNKAGLMDELGKIKRVMEKTVPVQEVLLVLDATTGQNGLSQAKVFGEVTGVTGVVLTKLDGSAKGGIIVQVQKIIGVPVKFVGLGEGPDDLSPFDAQVFVDELLA